MNCQVYERCVSLGDKFASFEDDREKLKAAISCFTDLRAEVTEKRGIENLMQNLPHIVQIDLLSDDEVTYYNKQIIEVLFHLIKSD